VKEPLRCWQTEDDWAKGLSCRLVGNLLNELKDADVRGLGGPEFRNAKMGDVRDAVRTAVRRPR